MVLEFHMINKIDWGKMGGLVPVIAQDFGSKDVLMQAYVNEQALKLTLNTGFAHYYSRSRKSIWKKGETSGHLQRIKKVYLDCDGDCLLYIVEQVGPACHTGKKTCFFNEIY